MTYYPGSVNKELIRGDDRTFKLSVVDQKGQPFDLSGSRVVFTLKRARRDGTGVHQDAPVVRLTSDDTSEIEILNQSPHRGRADIFLAGRLTRFLAPGSYVYDVQMRTAAGKTYTVAGGKLYLHGDVTAAEDGTAP